MNQTNTSNDSRSMGMWLVHGAHRAKIYSIKQTHDGELMTFVPARTGGHVTAHLSGMLNASDHHGFRETSSWLPSERQLAQLLHLVSYRIQPDSALISLPILGHEFISEPAPGTIIVDLKSLIDGLSKATIHLVTRRIMNEKGLEIGNWFFDVSQMAMIQIIDDDGFALGLPLDPEERARIMNQIPVLGPFTRLTDGLLKHASDLEEQGLVRPHPASEEMDLVSRAGQEQIANANWESVRFLDHIRGKVYRASGDSIEELDSDD